MGAPWQDVGSDADQGSAYVFRRNGDSWSQQARLVDGDGVADCFATSVAISGDTILVGTAADNVGASGHEGSVSVFAWDGTAWQQQAQLVASDGSIGDGFGRAVAISGDTAAVGAPENECVYVFVRSGGAWRQQAQLTATDGAAGDRFGGAVAVSGETIVVGAFMKNVGDTLHRGGAYAFARQGDTWSQQARLVPVDGPHEPHSTDDHFGCSVAVSGSTAVIGASGDIIGPNSEQGSAYVFVLKNGAWTQQARVVAPDGQQYDHFGTSVAVDGETFTVGCPFDDIPVPPSGLAVDQGSVYAFTRSGGVWSRLARLTAADGGWHDALGLTAVGVSGDTVLAGAWYDDLGANVDEGSAYAFVLSLPGRPTPKSPKGLIASRTPTFRWATAPRAATYEVRVYRGNSLIRSKAGIGSASWRCLRSLPRQVSLTWKVRARNEAGAGAWSPTVRFKVK